MLDFAIFAVVFVTALVIAVIYLYPRSPAKGTTVPGPEPSDEREGNLPDLGAAGSLHEYLMDLHDEYGDIVSFWWGQQLTVSIASPELFREHSKVFDRPPLLFKMFEPLIGPMSIQYANGADGRLRRSTYDPCLSHQNVSEFLSTFYEVSEEVAKKWSNLAPEEHIALSQYMHALIIKGTSLTLFGDYFKDFDHLVSFKTNYDIVWGDMEARLTVGEPEPDSPQLKRFERALKELKTTIKEIIKQRKDTPPKDGQPQQLIDVLMDSGFSDEIILSDAISMFIGSVHTSGNLLTWLFYFLASHQDVQEKLYKHIIDELGDSDATGAAISDMKYLRQCLDETMRCAVVAPLSARFQDFDSELGGHVIPKNTPVIHALGVVLQDEKFWPQPNKFDPDRFDAGNKIPLHAFEPFGFAGKRKCPGYRFSYLEVSVFVIVLLRKFKIHLVEGQVVNPVYGLVTHPNDEVWITVSKREEE